MIVVAEGSGRSNVDSRVVHEVAAIDAILKVVYACAGADITTDAIVAVIVTADAAVIDIMTLRLV